MNRHHVMSSCTRWSKQCTLSSAGIVTNSGSAFSCSIGRTRRPRCCWTVDSSSAEESPCLGFLDRLGNTTNLLLYALSLLAFSCGRTGEQLLQPWHLGAAPMFTLAPALMSMRCAQVLPEGLQEICSFCGGLQQYQWCEQSWGQ